ncbi:hypothetical protein CONPUDRAFT_162718 [Coniophora puteana RWD-64-598 SS2]|uniref:Gfd2/YDR514C-like C-terminal domain-containing protein n=1 Tax=Coniophora puteana (strain RWD-64-598) TaxID=741705 RepID=A0A5M3N3W6_CONPW|nr:uncharacterized protein CONPUDRAFT_162718 [Coniophora puteana RWD-64-598 SS2]EIW85545.1 hypothetical protein CONPUDRAFT_162718 [Coniophora puteana RWD-64-598 SS2]
MSYYQVGGFRAHSEAWSRNYDDASVIANIGAAPGPGHLRPDGAQGALELVFGVLPNGATNILLTKPQMIELTRNHGYRQPYHSPHTASSYLSLSPLSFDFPSRTALERKLEKYKQKSNKGKKAPADMIDNSPANKAYYYDGSDTTATPIGRARAFFEHNRVLYRTLMNSIDPASLSLPEYLPTKLSELRVISFAYNNWRVDARPRHERLGSPRLLDIGWAETEIKNFVSNKSCIDQVHCTIKENQTFKNASEPWTFLHGVTETMRLEDAGKKLKAILTRVASPKSQNEEFKDTKRHPVLLLVHDAEMAMAVLRHLGIDVLNSSGIDFFADNTRISDLLEFPAVSERYYDRKREYSPRRGPSVKKEEAVDYGYPDDRRDYRYASSASVKREDDRWRGGNRAGKDSRSATASSSSSYRERSTTFEAPPSDSGARGTQKVYVIDVRALHSTMMNAVGPDAGSIGRIAKDLDVAYDAPSERNGTVVTYRCCAGNEARLLLEFWVAMASGADIDTQNAERSVTLEYDPDDLPPAGPAPAHAPSFDPFDESVDPNDFEPAVAPGESGSGGGPHVVRAEDSDGWDEF